MRFLIPVINGLEKVSLLLLYGDTQFRTKQQPVLLDVLSVTVVLQEWGVFFW